MIKILAVIAVISIAIASSAHLRTKRQAAYVLPDGAELLIGSIKSSFSCSQDGYFADVDNACKIFHVCDSTGGSTRQYSFLCGNQTMFNQLSFTCSYPEDAVPCNNAADFFYLNARLGQEKELFHTNQDIEKGNQLLARRQ